MKVYKNTREEVMSMARALLVEEEDFMNRMKSLDCSNMVIYSEGKITAYRLLIAELEERNV